MNLRDWAFSILTADSLEQKLFTPDDWSDENPGPPLLFEDPVRPIGMGFQKKRKEERLPAFQDHRTKDARAICLHRFAGHELLAVEIMAQALLAFPEAPSSFRQGVAHTLKEEQGHVRLYMKRMEELGLKFGELPLYRHFWNHVPYLTTPTHYVSLMSLTFEMANLDFAPLYGKSFAHFDDLESAKVMETILADEIRHVAFGWKTLVRFHGEEKAWEIWNQSLPPNVHPKRAKGFSLFEENRKKAGIPQQWIDRLKKL